MKRYVKIIALVLAVLSMFSALNQISRWIVIVTVEKGALCARCYPRNF